MRRAQVSARLSGRPELLLVLLLGITIKSASTFFSASPSIDTNTRFVKHSYYTLIKDGI